MPPVYRGEIKIQGRSLRGWLANAEDPAERVPFELMIDGEVHGHYLADLPYQALERHRAFGDGAHGFALQLDREWISGGTQDVVLGVANVPTDVVLHAALGPAAGAYFDDSTFAVTKRSPEESEALRELAECRRLRRTAEAAERAKYAQRYFEILDGLSRTESGEGGWRHTLLLGREYYDAGRFADSAGAADRVLTKEPDHFRALMVKGRSLIALNHAGDARAVFLRAQAIEPSNRAPGNYVRVTETLALDEPGRGTLTAGTMTLDGDGSLAERIARQPFDWLLLGSGKGDKKGAASLNAPMLQRVGCATVSGRTYWRREALAGLAESGLLTTQDDAARWAGAYVPAKERPAHDRKVAIVAGENLRDDASLLALASHYAALGHEPVISHAADAASLRRFLLAASIGLVHAVSGTGYTVAGALTFTNVPFIYGVHSWVDMLGEDEDDAFDQETGAPRPRREFDFILAHAAQVYAASAELRDIVEQCFDVRCPIFLPLQKAA